MPYIAKQSISIDALPAKIWEALTNPEIIKKYLFGTEAKSDWNVGSAITYSGIWEGKPYEDKGKILELIPNEKLVTSYWSASFGPETSENKRGVVYEITTDGKSSILTITQDNNPTEESAKHSENNWKMVLSNLKNILENS